MESWKNNLVDGIDEQQHFLESKKITSFTAVREFFKNVFIDFLNEVDSSRAGITEKKHEITFYISDLSMAIIDQGENITIWKMDTRDSKIIAMLDFASGYCFVKYVNPVKIAYLCEDEIEKIFDQAFHQFSVIH